MGLSKSLKKIAKAVVNPVGAGIEKLTGMSQADQFKIGAGIGASAFGARGVMGMFGGGQTGNPGMGPHPESYYAGSLDRSSNGLMSSFNPWSFAAPVIGAGADIWSANKYASGQQEANERSIQSAREQMHFQERMSSTSHQREVEDLRAAGLNPVLSANSGASTPVGSSATAENAAPDTRGIVPKGVDSAVNLMHMKKEFEKADSSIYLNVAAAGREEANARVLKNSARQVGAQADITEQARDFAKRNPKTFSFGQWLKYMSPFASSANQLSHVGGK